MSDLQYPLQSRSPGSLFRLPPELRATIWEMIIYNPSPRVSSFSHDAHVGDGSYQLFVYDYPSLRYVCRESRQAAIYHSPAHGWQISGREHPMRRFEPKVDILYLGSGDFFTFFYDYSGAMIQQRIPNELIPTAVQVEETRHIAIDDIRIKYKLLLQSSKRLDKISYIVGRADMENTSNVTYNCFVRSKGIPKRPCTLGSIPSPEAIREEVSEASTSNYIRRGYWVNRACLKGKKASARFAKKADAAAHRLISRGLIPQDHNVPPLQPAMLLQPTRWMVDEEVEKSEETDAFGALRCYLAFAACWPLHQIMRILRLE